MSSCHEVVEVSSAGELSTAGRLTLIALAGQPNMGKSTLFNLLTGLKQHVGNWPGKTIDRREGTFLLDGHETNMVDLPGTYSLTANSPEEVIAREFILRENPDLVVAVVSAANLERSLYLVSELISLPANNRRKSANRKAAYGSRNDGVFSKGPRDDGSSDSERCYIVIRSIRKGVAPVSGSSNSRAARCPEKTAWAIMLGASASPMTLRDRSRASCRAGSSS